MTLTIRQHLEAIRDDHTPRDPGLNECLCGDYYDTCRSRMHAVAALKALDEAERNITGGLITGDGTPAYEYGDLRLVPDPAPPTENT